MCSFHIDVCSVVVGAVVVDSVVVAVSMVSAIVAVAVAVAVIVAAAAVVGVSFGCCGLFGGVCSIWPNSMLQGHSIQTSKSRISRPLGKIYTFAIFHFHHLNSYYQVEILTGLGTDFFLIWYVKLQSVRMYYFKIIVEALT